MSASTSPAAEHVHQAIDLLSMTTAAAIFYTLVVIVYGLSFRLSYTQLRDDRGKFRRQTMWLLIFQTVLLICATLEIIVKNRRAQVLYIDNSTLPGGPLGARAAHHAATLSRLDRIVNEAENLLILGVLLWRVRVIWSGTRFVIPVTAISSFLYIINAGTGISYNAIAWNLSSASPAVAPRAQGILYVVSEAFCFVVFYFMTLVIIARLVFMRRNHIQLMGKSDVAGQYLGIVSMLIESYALDTLWNIGTLIAFGLKSAPALSFFANCLLQIHVLTNFLVIYRVLSGRAWTRQTQDHLSTLRWAPNGDGTTVSVMDELQKDTSEISSRSDV